MRPPRANSPKLTRQVTRTESLRQRCNAKNTDEIIRFVRDIQFERQPTLLTLQKKAPLPGIGHQGDKLSPSDSGFIDRGLDSTDSDEEFLDNDIIYTQDRKIDRKIDPEFISLLTCPRGNSNATKDIQILSRSVPHGQVDFFNNNIQRSPRQNSFVKQNKRSLRNNGHRNKTKQLPPLSRDDYPERPSAPSPSRTPQISDYSFIEEEPVDHLEFS